MLLWTAIGLTLATYAGLIVFGLRNFFKYIVKQQYQLKLFYLFALLAAAARFGRYVAMGFNLILGNELHT